MTTRFGFVSTYPPTPCGLATFTASLLRALTASGVDSGEVARLVDEPHTPAGDEILADILIGDANAARASAYRLNECDIVIVQHEFGIYGGVDGEDVLALLADLTVPTIVVLHTVLTDPTVHQREVLEAVLDYASAIVVMSVVARDRLAGYRADMAKVSIIAHGAPEQARANTALRPTFRTGSATVLTWGLLGPGKGVEWAIEAMAQLRDLNPMPHYLVAGQTHPKVLLREGEAYRDSLVRLTRRLSLDASVSIDGRHHDDRSLANLIASADVVMLPYDSTDQTTSGVLIEAVAAGKPVVATRFPHAVELLSDGAGLLVAHQDPGAIATALRTVITRSDLAAEMSRAAEAAAPHLRWSTVAEQYRTLAARVVADAAAFAA